MKNLQIYIDSNSKKLVDTNGSILTTFPSISVGSTPILDIHLVNNLNAIDVSDAKSWRFAIDTDFLSGTTPMVRTTNDDIDSTYASSGLISVKVDSNTLEFIDKVNGRDLVNAYGEIYGLDSETNIIYDYRFRINALGTVDYNGGTPTPIEDDGITKTEVQAMINNLTLSGSTSYTLPTASTTTLGGIKVGDNLTINNGVLSVDSTLTSQISNNTTNIANTQSTLNSIQTTANNVSSNLTTHTDNSSIHVPSSGTTGYVLTKTSSGSEWSALPTSSSSTSYTLPTASSTTLGGIKVGDNLTISNGVLSVDSTLTSQISTLQDATNAATSMAGSAQTTAGQANITANNVSSNLTTHTDNSSIHVPSSGTTGYVLTKTSSGSEWAALPSSSSSGSTTTSTDAVEKLSAEFTPTESDLGKVYLWSVDDTTNMKKGHIYRVSFKEVTTTTESSGGDSITVTGATTNTQINGTYTKYGTILSEGMSTYYYTQYKHTTNDIYLTVGKYNDGIWMFSATGDADSIPGQSSDKIYCYYSGSPGYYSGDGSESNPYALTENSIANFNLDTNWTAGTCPYPAVTAAAENLTFAIGGSTTTTTTTEYYLEDITVECPVSNAYKEATDTIVYPSLKPYKITADNTIYLGCAGGVSGEVGYAEVVINVGASGSVLAGDNLTLVDSLTASKTNYCVVRWDGLSGQLFVWRTE